MAVKAAAVTRAPRGTKTLTQAFFSAAGSIPEAQRDAVVKAALAAIRDQLKDDREQVKVAKAKAKVEAGKAPTAGRQKIAAPAPKKQPVVASKGQAGTQGVTEAGARSSVRQHDDHKQMTASVGRFRGRVVDQMKTRVRQST